VIAAVVGPGSEVLPDRDPHRAHGEEPSHRLTYIAGGGAVPSVSSSRLPQGSAT
jgi:hypothetical protein